MGMTWPGRCPPWWLPHSEQMWKDMDEALSQSFDMRQFVYHRLPYEAVTARFDALMGSAYSVSLFTHWNGDFVDQAWLKARPCAGDLALGAEVLATLRPFVFPRYTSPTIVEEVLELNRRIKRELLTPSPTPSYPRRGGNSSPIPVCSRRTACRRSWASTTA